MPARRWRPMMLLVAGLGLAACATWQPATVPAPQVILEEQPSSVRLTLRDGERMVLDKPELRADSIIGEQTSTTTSRGPNGRTVTTVTDIQTRSVPLAAVSRLDVRHTNVAAAIFTTIPLGLAVMLLAALGSCEIC